MTVVCFIAIPLLPLCITSTTCPVLSSFLIRGKSDSN